MFATASAAARRLVTDGGSRMADLKLIHVVKCSIICRVRFDDALHDIFGFLISLRASANSRGTRTAPPLTRLDGHEVPPHDRGIGSQIDPCGAIARSADPQKGGRPIAATLQRRQRRSGVHEPDRTAPHYEAPAAEPSRNTIRRVKPFQSLYCFAGGRQSARWIAMRAAWSGPDERGRRAADSPRVGDVRRCCGSRIRRGVAAPADAQETPREGSTPGRVLRAGGSLSPVRGACCRNSKSRFDQSRTHTDGATQKGVYGLSGAKSTSKRSEIRPRAMTDER